jgi:two-component system nitrate/nitrite response regulator NarL
MGPHLPHVSPSGIFRMPSTRGLAAREGLSQRGAAWKSVASENGPPPSVLIVGRNQLFAEALALNLQEEGFEIIGSCPDAEAIPRGTPLPPDVGVIDLRPHDTEDLAAGQALLGTWPDLRLLALTPVGDHFAPRAAMTEGFHGCVSKEAPLADLADSIRAVFGGDQVMPDVNGVKSRAGGRHSVAGAAARARNLTPRELEVLALLVQGRRSAEIAESLGIGLNTVRTHVQNILTKLHVHSRLEAASVAVKHGLVAVPSGSSRALIPLR